MDKLTFYFFLFIAFCSKDVLCKRREHKLKEDGGKIVGGNDTNIETYPHQAYLLLYDGRNNYQCGGSIISQYYILTAAHCLAGILTINVRIGSTNSDSGGLEYKTSLFISHPLYNAGTSDYDVGWIRIISGMTLDGTKARAIKIVESGSDVPDGQNVIATGWGATSENGDVSSTLMAVEVPAVGRQRCNELQGGLITSRMFCAGTTEGGKDTCQGDSGGPAVTNGLLAGATSFGNGCARPDSPGVYTRFGYPAIRLFIKTTTGV